MNNTNTKNLNDYIYIIFSRTNSKMGAFIRLLTNCEYNHVSVLFHKESHTMYSFARYHKNAPLYGGFIEESPLRYFTEEKGAIVKAARIPVSKEHRKTLEKILTNMIADDKRYVYNTPSALLYWLHRRIKIKNAFTCVEFAVYILGAIGVSGIVQNEFYTIPELETLLSEYIIYEGDIRQIWYHEDWGNDHYDKKLTKRYTFFLTAHHFCTLLYRMVLKLRVI